MARLNGVRLVCRVIPRPKPRSVRRVCGHRAAHGADGDVPPSEIGSVSTEVESDDGSVVGSGGTGDVEDSEAVGADEVCPRLKFFFTLVR